MRILQDSIPNQNMTLLERNRDITARDCVESGERERLFCLRNVWWVRGHRDQKRRGASLSFIVSWNSGRPDDFCTFGHGNLCFFNK